MKLSQIVFLAIFCLSSGFGFGACVSASRASPAYQNAYQEGYNNGHSQGYMSGYDFSECLHSGGNHLIDDKCVSVAPVGSAR